MAKIAFVNDRDEIIGSGSKEEAWKNGNIHRIVRIFIFNSQGEMLIQKRADNVVLFPGRWDHAVGGHVDEGEDYIDAAKREAKEELGIDNIEPREIKKYFVDIFEEGKIKKRFNMIYEAIYEGPISLSKEVASVKWISLVELEKWMNQEPEDFTGGFIKSLEVYKGVQARQL